MMTSWSVNWPPSWAPADHDSVNEVANEAVLWERLSKASRRAPLDPAWLGEVYSPSLSDELRHAIAEKIGMLAERGWPFIQKLMGQYGPQDELILAAGLSHQPESREWLMEHLRSIDTETEPDRALLVLQSLGCWGGELPLSLIEQTLEMPGMNLRLAGLQLLSFHAHRLDDRELLRVCDKLLKDFRDPVALATIRLLQRRNGTAITERLAQLTMDGADPVAAAALKALGCIATPASQRWLLELSQALPEGDRRQMACKQLKQQYRT